MQKLNYRCMKENMASVLAQNVGQDRVVCITNRYVFNGSVTEFR